MYLLNFVYLLLISTRLRQTTTFSFQGLLKHCCTKLLYCCAVFLYCSVVMCFCLVLLCCIFVLRCAVLCCCAVLLCCIVLYCCIVLFFVLFLYCCAVLMYYFVFAVLLYWLFLLFLLYCIVPYCCIVLLCCIEDDPSDCRLLLPVLGSLRHGGAAQVERGQRRALYRHGGLGPTLLVRCPQPAYLWLHEPGHQVCQGNRRDRPFPLYYIYNN